MELQAGPPDPEINPAKSRPGFKGYNLFITAAAPFKLRKTHETAHSGTAARTIIQRCRRPIQQNQPHEA
jgi:hypothetical protein